MRGSDELEIIRGSLKCPRGNGKDSHGAKAVGGVTFDKEGGGKIAGS